MVNADWAIGSQLFRCMGVTEDGLDRHAATDDF